MPCVNISFSSLGVAGSCCASSVSGSHIAISVTNASGAATIPFEVYLDEYIPQSNSNWASWTNVGTRTGVSSSSGTHTSMSPNTGGGLKTYRVRCRAHRDDNYIFTTASFTHRG